MTDNRRTDNTRVSRSAAGALGALRTIGAWLFDHRVLVAESVGAFAVIALSAWSAILVKEATTAPTLLSIENRAAPADTGASDTPGGTILATLPARTLGDEPVVIERTPVDPAEADASIRWFNGRPIKPSETLVMRVTAYSPDHRSCGIYADGMTATLHHVTTNGGNLVAADPRVLPMGSLVSVPGYDEGRVVPVLDKGGAIKGHRLDVLYPTHGRALRWGVQDLRVTVWAYADGRPAGNPRHER